MFKTLLAAPVLVTVLATGFGATAANAADAQADATVKIMRPLTVVNNQKLDFGVVIPGTTAGTVKVDKLGVRTCTAVTCTKASTAASFTATGTSGELVNVTWDPTVTLTSGTQSMTVALDANTGTQLTLVGAAATGGTASYSIGGTLAVAANQAEGTYAGQFKSTVTYN